MATLSSVKKHAESSPLYMVSAFFHLFFTAAAAGAAWYYFRIWQVALGAGLGMLVLLSIWGYLIRWQGSVVCVSLNKINFAKLNLLPKDFVFWDSASPRNLQSRIEATFRTALETAQNNEKSIVAQRHTLEKYLGSEASRQARTSNAALGGQLQKVFILFSDIRGFTRMSEQLTPQEIMRVLNQIYTALGSAIEAGDGEINKFIGDAVLAYFKRSAEPEKEKDDARKAVHAALEMHEKFGKAIKSIGVLSEKSISIGLGIGIVAGEVLMGNLGSRNRMEFTLIGDSVNLASRLCGIAPEWEILVNEELAMMVTERFHIESRMPVQLKGKSEKVTPYCIMGELRDHQSLGV